NMDRLAERGVRFEECYTPSPLCGPARASVISGVYPHNTHVHSNGGILPRDDESLFGTLRDAGYYTALVGDAEYGQPGVEDHLGENEEYLHARGFEYVHETPGAWGAGNSKSYFSDYLEEKGLWAEFSEDYDRRMAESGHWASVVPFEDHPDSYIRRQAVEFVEEYDRERPFCLQVGFNGPHDPMDPPERMLDRYDPADLDGPEPSLANPDWVPDRARAFMEQGALVGPEDSWWRPKMSPEATREWRSYYYGKVSLVDYWLGELLDALEARGELENTLVVYTSDHGEMAGDKGMLTKHVFFDQSVRVPCIVSWPEQFAAGAATDALVSLLDLYPTFLDVAAAGEGRTFGASLAPVLDDPARSHREAVFSFVHGFASRSEPYDYKTMVATADHKYCVDSWGEGYMLFDRTDDPGETTNYLGHPDYEDAERALRDRLLRFFQTTGTQFHRRGQPIEIQDAHPLPGYEDGTGPDL
ncbi:MAG: sulfatase, partial [Halobacteriaceae archaeon]